VNESITFFSVFLTGLLGSVHCIGMCSSIVGALTMSVPNQVRQSQLQFMSYLLIYNLGRLSSYTIAGFLVGFLGEQFINLLPIANPHKISLWVSGTFMIMLGLYLGKWWQALAFLERVGNYWWSIIEPLGCQFLPVKTLWRAYGLGLIWGWLPCSLVYSVLALSLVVGNMQQGGLLMLTFGLSTLPTLFALGFTLHGLIQFVRQLIVQRIIALLIILIWLEYFFIIPLTHY